MNELIDLTLIRQIAAVMHEPGGIPKLLEGFAADARRTLKQMHNLAKKGHAAAIAYEAHRLRGSSASVGAVRLAAEFVALERSAREGRSDLAPQIDLALAVLDSTQIVFSCLALGSKLESAG